MGFICDVKAIKEVRTAISQSVPILEVVTDTLDSRPQLWFMFATDGQKCLIVFLRTPDLREKAFENLAELEKRGLARKFACSDGRITNWLRLASQLRGFKLRVFLRGMRPFLHYYETEIFPIETWMQLEDAHVELLERVAEIMSRPKTA